LVSQRRETSLDPDTPAGLLYVRCWSLSQRPNPDTLAGLALVCAFEFANGFHDTANAVATVNYTNSLKPRVAVVWSGIMNFLGVLLGGITVAYALVELLPPEVLSPPNGSPAVPMLVALFATALAWNV
jgi:phosphate/sulfate permease